MSPRTRSLFGWSYKRAGEKIGWNGVSIFCSYYLEVEKDVPEMGGLGFFSALTIAPGMVKVETLQQMTIC